jgi:hypothetical protein
MSFWLLAEATLAFVVFCADSVGEDGPRPWPEHLLRAVCWPVTIWVWFTHRSLSKLARFGAIVWLGVTTGWLLSLERDRIHSWVFFAAAEATMAFVVFGVDAMSSDLHRQPIRRAFRSVLWVKSITDYLRDTDNVRLVQASVTVWVLLTSGWLLGLEADRIAQPLGWLSR